MNLKITRQLRSPLRWFGGKGILASRLLQLIPAHQTYCEVFGGAASLLFAKEPTGFEVYNDLDDRLLNFFRVLRDPEQSEELIRLYSLTPYHRQEYYNCCNRVSQHISGEIEMSNVEYAWSFYVAVMQSFSARMNGWGYRLHANMSEVVSSWVGRLSKLPVLHQRLMRVQIDSDSFEKVIDRYDDKDTFFYLDPPYVSSTRRKGGYVHEMTDDQHRLLIDMCIKSKSKIMLSGYSNDIYTKLTDNGWFRADIQTSCDAAGRTRNSKLQGKGSALKLQPRTESVYMNYRIRDTEYNISPDRHPIQIPLDLI